MSSIKASREVQTIQYLIIGDPRGEKLLRKYYGASLYGMIIRMRYCPIQSTELLESTIAKIQTDIGKFSSNLSFFTRLMQIARKLSVEYGEVTATPIEQLGGKTDSAFSLVMHQGLNLIQAAAILEVNTQQVAHELRMGLQEFTVKE